MPFDATNYHDAEYDQNTKSDRHHRLARTAGELESLKTAEQMLRVLTQETAELDLQLAAEQFTRNMLRPCQNKNC